MNEVLEHVRENEGKSSSDVFVERELRNTSIKWRKPKTASGSTLLGAYAIKMQRWRGKAQANVLQKQLSGKLVMSKEMKKSLSRKLSGGKSSGKSLGESSGNYKVGSDRDTEEDPGTPGTRV